ncbi:histidine utilization protein HutD [Caballeronia novacaledonica]|uniref:Histidine utilization protein HutD n=1 Tax=Caballeronia novacaledonica TaxID=1544861 RepID=A0A2U3HYQ9_9BURK|nr:HutD family protein [Caballeronia novacaledonica]SPB12940.1 histidine utilization protein HutD [Caballeronia novacaledonica]
MIIRADSLAATSWKNGGGVTREIAAGPAGASLDAFAWRLSLADVASDGAFSAFAGVDRVLVLLDGAGMRLTQADGRVHTLDAPLAIARFAGETPIHATLINGPTRDFNVMVRRDRARAAVDVRRGSHSLGAGHDLTFIFCVRGRVHIKAADDTRHTLETGDTLRLDHAAGLQCDASDETSWLHIDIKTETGT